MSYAGKLFLSMVSVMLVTGLPCFAGGGHDHSHGEEYAHAEYSNEILLSKAAITNLGMRSHIARAGTLKKTVRFFAQAIVHPNSHHHVSAGFKGKISALSKLTGESVKRGDVLGAALPIVLGNKAVRFKSPIDGMITKAPESIGVVFEEGEVVFDVSDLRHMLIRADVYQGESSQLVQVGQHATAIFPDSSIPALSGVIDRVDASLQEDLPLMHIYMNVENLEYLLRPNMRGTLSVVIGESEKGIRIPEMALLGDIGQYFVYVKDFNRFERRTVRIADRGNGFAIVSEGVQAGERIVTVGQYQLQFAESDTDRWFGEHGGHAHGHGHEAHGHSHE